MRGCRSGCGDTTFDEFVGLIPAWRYAQAQGHLGQTPDGRWCCYDYEEIQRRDKLSIDLFRIKDQSLTGTDSLPAPDIIAAEIVDELEAALEQFSKISSQLNLGSRRT